MEREPTVALLHADGRVEQLPGPSAEVEIAQESIRVTALEPFEGCVRLDVPALVDREAWTIPGLVYHGVPPGPLAQLEADAWSFRCDRAASPMVIAGDVSLAIDEHSSLGEHGIGIALHEDGTTTLRAFWPFREEPARYDGSPAARPAVATTHAWRAGESHELRAVIGDGTLPAPSGTRVEFDATLEQDAEAAAYGLHRWHYRSDPPRLIETATFDRAHAGDDRDAMHVGWVSGLPFAHALLRHGRRVARGEYVDAAVAVLDFVADDLTPGGTCWGQWTSSRGWTHGWHPDHRRLHSRTLGDAALFLARALRDEPGRANWERALRSNLEAVCAAQRADGALPSALDVEDASGRDWHGTSGLAWIPPLVLGANLLGEPRWADAARRAGAYFLDAVRAGALLGAPEDVATAPTSEDGYMAVMAYVALDELDPDDDRWLAAACAAAAFTHTFRYTYDVHFGVDTDLGRLGFRTRGGDQASPTNQHVHVYGLVALPEWVQLARRTGDDRYIETARDHLAFARQCLVRRDGEQGGMRGMVAERCFQTDYVAPKGTLGRLSHAWCVGLLLQACEDALADPSLTG